MAKLSSNKSLRLPTATKETTPGWTPPEMPACLDENLREDYNRVCRNLFKEGLWHDDRMPLVIAYLSAGYALAQCALSIQEDGVIDPGTMRANPAISMQNSLTGALRTAGAALGLTVVRSAPIVKADPGDVAEKGGAWAAAAKKG